MKNDGNELVPCYVGRAECGCMVSVQVADAKVSADELTEFFRGHDGPMADSLAFIDKLDADLGRGTP